MKAKLIKEIGTRAFLRVYWHTDSDCPKYGCHNVMVPLMDSDKPEDWDLGGKPEDYSPERWPTKCDHCGAPVPSGDSGIEVNYQIFRRRLYDTASGNPEPGDIFWAPWKHDPKWQKFYCPWDDCNDPRGHLICVLPNGFEWDIDSRANNCTMPNDKTHRCWVRHGEPPNIHVDKNGHTCQAGAGSILSGNYHGFLHNGELTGC